jgi:tol-pal system beta propeller repeat protein TolB
MVRLSRDAWERRDLDPILPRERKGRRMTVRKMFVTTMIVAAVLLACAALLLGAWAEEARGAFPGKNGRIIFHAHRDNQTGLFALWPDGTDERLIVAEGVYANYSPDGKKIVYSVDQGGTGNDPDIFVANAGGAAPQNLTRSEASEHGGAFSPDGSQIVFSRRDASGNQDVWIMDADGTDQRRLTDNPGRDASPSWSPDGSTIVFESERNGSNYDIWAVNPDGSNQRNLTSSPDRSDFQPSWSPDGSKIAFDTNQFGGDVWVMDADGTDQRNLTPTTVAGEYEPACSPNGRKIAYARSSRIPGQKVDIYVMRASDGLGRTNITDTPASREGGPDWQPILQATP